MSSSSSLTGGKYTRDLKLRVLEHYFRSGGDVFGNKQATAKKFGVDSKTINRFLKIPELVRVARKNAKSSKASASSNDGFKEPPAPGPSGAGRTRPPQRQSVRITLPSQPDEAIVSQNADAHSSSIVKLLKIFELGTQEIRDLLAAECDLIYECRACRALFRSVANLLAHKRRYCTRPAVDTRQVFGSGPGQSLAAPSDGVVVLPLPAAINRLPEVRQAAAAEARAAAAQPVPPVRLEPLPGSAAAVVQTVGEPERSVGERLDEVRRMEAAAQRTVRLGRDGRVVESDGEEEEEAEETEEAEQAEGEDGRHVCQHCNTTFATRKTLSHHMRSLHASTRIYYPCCLCSAAFINMFSVERHLQKVHKKKQEEVELLKEGIKQKSFHRNVADGQADGAAASTNMPVKVGPPPAGLLRCSECLLCYPSAQLLAAHQLTAHAPTAERRVQSAILVRNDYLNPRAAPLSLGAMAAAAESAATAAAASAARLVSSQPPAPPPPPAASATEPSPVSEEAMLARLSALSDMKRLQCKQCGSSHKTVHNLRRHVAGHIGWTRHGCPRCSHRCYSRFDVIRHLKSHHKLKPRQAEELMSRTERRKPAARSSGRRKSSSAEEEETAGDGEQVKVTEPSVEPAPRVQMAELPQRTYEMRDLTIPRPPPSPSATSQVPAPAVLPGVLPPRPPPLPGRPCPSPPPEDSHVAPPPTLTRRRPGRKNLTDIIRYIRSAAEPSTPDSGPGGSSQSPAEGNIFQLVPSGMAEVSQEPVATEEAEADQDSDADDAADAAADDDDELEEFMSLSAGAELEPGAVWRTLPPLVPLVGGSRPGAGPRGAGTPLPGAYRQVAALERLAETSQQHDCNENIELRPPSRARTPAGESKSLPATPKRSPTAPCLLNLSHTRSLDEHNFFPRVLLTDIALRTWNSSPTPARPASPAGGAVYPAGARLDPTAAGGEADSPAARRGSPSGAASASGGVSPTGVEQERRSRPPRKPKTPRKLDSVSDLNLVSIGESEATVAAAAAGASPRSPDRRLKGSAESERSSRPVQMSVTVPTRVVPTKRAFIPATVSPSSSDRSSGSSPPAAGRRGRKRPTPTAAAAAGAVGGPKPVPYIPSVWPPLVRKRSWSSPTEEPPNAVITAAESVKRRRYRQLSGRAEAR